LAKLGLGIIKPICYFNLLLQYEIDVFLDKLAEYWMFIAVFFDNFTKKLFKLLTQVQLLIFEILELLKYVTGFKHK